jgi:formamidopyrimidine-DNA glycosylase
VPQNHDVPELVEVEIYRRTAERVVGRPIVSVEADDGWFLKRGTTAEGLGAALVGRCFGTPTRIGKLLLLPVGDSVLGLRFGMTGRLVVDGEAGIDELLYSSHRPDPAFVRFAVRFADGGSLLISDPRRLGGVELDPDEGLLGPDATSLTRAQLASVLAGGSGTLKARLMDQSRLAGVGNLIADEVLWRAGLDPVRPADSLTSAQVTKLARVLVSTIADLQERGGSHLGDLMPGRSRDGCCPRCGRGLDRRTIGGRTTYSCPKHQPPVG